MGGITVVCDEPMDGRPWTIEQMGLGFYVIRWNEDGSATTIATANTEDAAVNFMLQRAREYL